MAPTEEVLAGGNSSSVARAGHLVHRTAGPWTPAVHELLTTLRASGIVEVPEPHGFDDQGSKYDGQGRLEDWWTSSDRAEFEARAEALVAQYDAFHPAQLSPEHTVNGALTIGENIGDLGGLSIALKAYRIALGTDLAHAPVVDGLTGAERVFLSWAQVWQTAMRDEAMVQRLATDPHSPAEFRCNGVVRNIDEFYSTYNVQPGDALYLAPEERVRIW